MIEYDIKSASGRELLNKLEECRSMISSPYITESCKQMAHKLKHRIREEILLRLDEVEPPKEELKPAELDMDPFEALDKVKALRKGYNQCIGPLYKNVGVNMMQDHLEKCIAKWGDKFMDCVQRELAEETTNVPEIVEKLWGGKGKRYKVFAEYLVKAESSD